jgi:hypothetical protein
LVVGGASVSNDRDLEKGRKRSAAVPRASSVGREVDSSNDRGLDFSIEWCVLTIERFCLIYSFLGSFDKELVG